jgi:hypothetical protein
MSKSAMLHDRRDMRGGNNEFPTNCPIGMTYFYAPRFLVGDYNVNSGGVFTSSSLISFGSAFPFLYTSKQFNPAGLTITVAFTAFGDAHAGGVWPGSGVGVSTTPNPNPQSDSVQGAFYFNTRLGIADGPSLLASSPNLDETVPQSFIVKFQFILNGANYDLLITGTGVTTPFTISATIPAYVISASPSNIGFVMDGPGTSDVTHYNHITSLYAVGPGLPNTCKGP